jgi:hypothetical protein
VTQRSQASPLMSLHAEQLPFGSRDKRDFGLSYFRGMCSRKLSFLGAGFFLKTFSSSLCYLNANIAFRAVLFFTYGFSLICLGAF